MALHLPDVSEFQPDIDWSKVVKANGGAAIIRVCYGTGCVDKQWAAGRRAAAHKAGVKALGLYQYVRADQDAGAQAAEFVKLVGQLDDGEFAYCDLEEGSGSQLGRADEWLSTVDATLKSYAGYGGAWLYSGESFASAHGLAPIFATRS